MIVDYRCKMFEHFNGLISKVLSVEKQLEGENYSCQGLIDASGIVRMYSLANPHTNDSYDPSRSCDTLSSQPGECTDGIPLTPTSCDALPLSTHPFASRTDMSSSNVVDLVERWIHSNPPPAWLSPAKSHSSMTTKDGAWMSGALVAYGSTLTAGDHDQLPQSYKPQPYPKVEEVLAPSPTSSRREATTLDDSEGEQNAQLTRSQRTGILEGYGADQAGINCLTEPNDLLVVAAVGSSHGLHDSSASTSPYILLDHTTHKNQDLPSRPSSSHQVSPLAEVTDAYTGSQGGWKLPFMSPASTSNQRPIPHATGQHVIIKSQKPFQSAKVEKNGIENQSIEAKRRHYQLRPRRTRGAPQGLTTDSSLDPIPLPSSRGQLRV
ncbi:hypothetical protein VP01_583g3 [Puccinia sorghi]|uniref:Uncharacterized protein n=1 Tax=Puccinia sorghi TaxID=27349 RepID=A0A0L6UK52_9BASI|nr:hypothetical protein VP01_583g3 [Puccinia sorghi]